MKVKPHGKAKAIEPYFRTSESAKECMKDMAKSKTPKALIDSITKVKGGEIDVATPSDLPRNRQQISNLRRGKKDCNVLYSVMLECKLVQGKGSAFVRDVKATVAEKGRPFPLLDFFISILPFLHFHTFISSFPYFHFFISILPFLHYHPYFHFFISILPFPYFHFFISILCYFYFCLVPHTQLEDLATNTVPLLSVQIVIVILLRWPNIIAEP